RDHCVTGVQTCALPIYQHLGHHLDVEAELRVDLFLDAGASEERPSRPARRATHVRELRGKEQGRDRGDERRELSRFCGELTPTLRGDAIELCAPPLIGNAPFRLDPAVALHAVERRVEGAFLHPHHLAGPLRDPAQNPEAVAWAERKRLEDERVEGSVQSVSGRHWWGRCEQP